MNWLDKAHFDTVLRYVRCLLTGLLALPASCGQAAPHEARPHGDPVLRAVYRDAGHHLLVVLPDGSHGTPHGDCALPLLIDDESGGVRQITATEASVWMRHMQLSGATHGTCP